MFRARLLLLSLLAVGLGCSRTARVPADWAGDYTYDADLGRNAADTGMVVEYTLHLQDKTCTFEADGYQTYEQILCTVHPNGSSLDILFRSFANGTTKNSYNNEPYQCGQPLFTLVHAPHKSRIITRWAAYTAASNNDTPPAPGLYFERSKAAPSSAH